MNKSIKKEVYSFIMKEIKNPFWRTAAEYGTITISIWIMVIGIYFFKFKILKFINYFFGSYIEHLPS